MALNICPNCGGLLYILSAKCNLCNASFNGNFQMGFLNSLSAQSVNILLAFLAARGKLQDTAFLLRINRNAAAGLLATLRMEMVKNAQLLQSNPEAALFCHMVKQIDAMHDDEQQNSEVH